MWECKLHTFSKYRNVELIRGRSHTKGSLYPEGQGFLGDPVAKNLPTNAGDSGSIPHLGRAPGKGNGNPL